MNIDVVTRALEGWPPPVLDGGHVLVPTHCLYPSNGVVTIWVGASIGSLLVHDARGALDEAASAGADFPPAVAASMMRKIVKGYGLSVDSTGLISADHIGENDLMSVIVLVANASKEAAETILGKFRPRMRRDIKGELSRLLELRFPKLVARNHSLVGASHKPHRFDNIVRLGGERHLVLDAVIKEASSINAALVSHLDIRAANLPHVEQRIIYDDQEDWTSADLSLLTMGAPAVPFSRASEMLERLAA